MSVSTKLIESLARGMKGDWVPVLVVAGFLIAAGGFASQARREPQEPDEFFSREVYPVFERAQCRVCHVENGLASSTQLHFPAPGASAEQVGAFGFGLAALVDRHSPEDSLLLNKPTNRLEHTGGERIRPGSEEEKLLLRWVNHLAKVSDQPTAASSAEGETLPKTPIRRLTHSQYNNTVRDLLGDRSRIADRFPPEDFANGFKNQAVIQGISPLLAEIYSQAAETLARNAYRLGELEQRLPCQPSSAADRDCRDRFLRHFGLRAFRQPLTEAEVHRYGRIFDRASTNGDDFLRGAQIVVEAMLQSPKFLFHLEADPAEKAFERASRLAYFLWNTMPDGALLSKAAKGDLDTVEGVEKTARWMLEDPRARAALDEFFAQWLRFDLVLSTFRDSRLFPQFTSDLAAAMVEETRNLLNYLVWNDKSFMEAFTADYGFINAELASLYDLPSPPGEFELVSFPSDANRAGLLGQATFLASTSKPGETSPTVRGIFVREQFLCQHVPDPPPGVNTSLPEISPDQPQTNRERLREHSENPGCASCHRLMDPIGFGLENYDAIGSWRDKQVIQFRGPRRGDPVTVVELAMDTTGIVTGLSSSDETEFSGAKELGRLLAKSEVCQECIVRQLFRYGFGRAETPADRATIRQATAAFRESGFRLKEVLVALVTSPQFVGETSGKTGQGRVFTDGK